MSIMDLPSPDSISLPQITEKHFELALKNTKASVGKEDLAMQEKFTEMYGERGSVVMPTEYVESTPENPANEIEDEEFLQWINKTTDRLKQMKQEKKKKSDNNNNNNRKSLVPS